MGKGMLCQATKALEYFEKYHHTLQNMHSSENVNVEREQDQCRCLVYNECFKVKDVSEWAMGIGCSLSNYNLLFTPIGKEFIPLIIIQYSYISCGGSMA